MKWLQFLKPADSIDYHKTRDIIDGSGPDEVTILDVRQPNEYEGSHIPGAKLIPLPELPDRLAEIDRGKPVLVY
ncbi:MAG: hypothetical protein MI802_27570 [Desulfobacterales bacterium]|nr:hypothetical protein [Desulfobacterales bacterium]